MYTHICICIYIQYLDVLFLFLYVFIYACRFLATSNKLFPDCEILHSFYRREAMAMKLRHRLHHLEFKRPTSKSESLGVLDVASLDGAKLGEIDTKKNRRWPEMSWWSHMFEQGVQKICVSLKMPGWYKLTSMFFCEPGMISSRLRGFLRFQPWWGLGLSPAWKWSTHQAHILSFLLGFHLFAGHKAAKGSRNRRLVLDQGNLRTSL